MSKLNPQQKLLSAYRAVAATQAGQEVFRHILEQAGFHVSSFVLQGSTIDTGATLANEGRRGLYLDIRKHIPPAYLRNIENPPSNEDTSS